jgi:hypothetical protein
MLAAGGAESIDRARIEVLDRDTVRVDFATRMQ